MKLQLNFLVLVGALLAGSVHARTLVEVEPEMLTSESPLVCEGEIKYLPWPAFTANNYTDVHIVDGKLQKKSQDWPEDPSQINKLLPNIATQVELGKAEASGTVGGLFGGTLYTKHITIDFMKYRSEAIQDSAGTIFTYGRVGAGMRLQIDLETTEANIGGSLLAIASSAKAGKTTGSISVDVIGMSAPEITLSMPFTTDISDTSIQKVVEALAVVKTKFHDPTTILKPQFVAKIICLPPSKK